MFMEDIVFRGRGMVYYEYMWAKKKTDCWKIDKGGTYISIPFSFLPQLDTHTHTHTYTYDTAFDSLSDEEWKKIEDSCMRIQENHPGFFQFYNIHWYWHSNDCKQEMRWMVDMLPRLYIELGIILRARGIEGNWRNIQRCMTENRKRLPT